MEPSPASRPARFSDPDAPAIYSLWRGRQVQWVKGPRPPKKTWDELSRQFVEWERREHAVAVHRS